MEGSRRDEDDGTSFNPRFVLPARGEAKGGFAGYRGNVFKDNGWEGSETFASCDVREFVVARGLEGGMTFPGKEAEACILAADGVDGDRDPK